MFTNEQADSRDREARAELASRNGYQVCRGYPLDRTCPVFIPWTKASSLCHFCSKTRDMEQAEIQRNSFSLATVGEILANLPVEEVVKACPCGGDAEAAYHEASLLHIRWTLRPQ